MLITNNSTTRFKVLLMLSKHGQHFSILSCGHGYKIYTEMLDGINTSGLSVYYVQSFRIYRLFNI